MDSLDRVLTLAIVLTFEGLLDSIDRQQRTDQPIPTEARTGVARAELIELASAREWQPYRDLIVLAIGGHSLAHAAIERAVWHSCH